MGTATQNECGPVERSIREKLDREFSPSFLDVINESSQHSVPPGSETHFKVVVITPRFEGERAVARHRAIHGALAQDLANRLHALSIEAWTPAEWTRRGGTVVPSPGCGGGSKAG